VRCLGFWWYLCCFVDFFVFMIYFSYFMLFVGLINYPPCFFLAGFCFFYGFSFFVYFVLCYFVFFFFVFFFCCIFVFLFVSFFELGLCFLFWFLFLFWVVGFLIVGVLFFVCCIASMFAKEDVDRRCRIFITAIWISHRTENPPRSPPSSIISRLPHERQCGDANLLGRRNNHIKLGQ